MRSLVIILCFLRMNFHEPLLFVIHFECGIYLILRKLEINMAMSENVAIEEFCQIIS